MAPDASDSDDEAQAIGWDAINAALSRIYGDQEPLHYGTVLPAALGGNDPLNGISIYECREPTPHFHYVTYGFSELFEKESDDPEYSGFGFELTFRLARHGEQEPPTWPLSFLQNLAKYVFRTGNVFDERHHTTLNGKIALNEETRITAIFFILDPKLGEISTQNGRVKFLQIVGLCDDEYQLLKEGHFDAVTQRVQSLVSPAVTDIYRESILEDPAVADALRAAPPQNAQDTVYGTLAEWEAEAGRVRVRLGATVIDDVLSLLEQRLRQGAHFIVHGNKSTVVFEPGQEVSFSEKEKSLRLKVPQAAVDVILSTLKPKRGVYSWDELPGLQIEVVPIEIKDAQGKVIQVVG